MKKIKNQRGIRKIIPLHSEFAESANGTDRDTEVLCGQKGKEIYQANVVYKCVGDPKEVRAPHKALKDIDNHKTTIIRNRFGKWWLGNLVGKLGSDWMTLNYRGEIVITDWLIICSRSLIVRHDVNRKKSGKL